MKKILALVLALAMILAVTVASAATIKIDRDSTYEGTGARTYSAYKVLDADTAVTAGTNTEEDPITVTYGKNAIAYTMATNSPWVDVMTANAQIWFDVRLSADQSKYVVTLKDGVENTTATAQAIATYLKDNMPQNLNADATITPGDGTQAGTTVPNGYYIILASDGATNLTLVTGNVNIHEKNTYISTGKTSAQTNHYVGENVTYTATVDIPADTNPDIDVVLHDTMDSVLKFNNDVTAKIKNIGETGEGTAFTGFTVATSNLGDECTFHVVIDVNENTLGKEIVFSYSAEVTSAAATETGLVNKLFGQHGDYKTTPVDVYDYTFGFDFEKLFDGSDSTDLTAHFELRTNATDANSAIQFNALENGIQKKVDTDDQDGSKDIVIHNKETINLAGLKAGTYYLVETATSTGYNLLDGPVTVTITDTTTDPEHPTRTVTTTGGNMVDGVIQILNKAGTVLPSTGGIGTTIFYVLGGILVIGAAVILVARRKAHD